MRHLFTALCLLVAVSASGLAADAAPAGDKPATPYPLDTCIVSGEKLGGMGDAVVLIHDGREIKFCCASCVKQFNKDPAGWLAKIDAAAAKAKAAPAAEPAPAKHD